MKCQIKVPKTKTYKFSFQFCVQDRIQWSTTRLCKLNATYNCDMSSSLLMEGLNIIILILTSNRLFGFVLFYTFGIAFLINFPFYTYLILTSSESYIIFKDFEEFYLRGLIKSMLFGWYLKSPRNFWDSWNVCFVMLRSLRGRWWYIQRKELLSFLKIW